MLFGAILTGWAAALLYAAMGAIQVCIGAGLIHLWEKARAGAILYFAFSIANGGVSFLGSGYARILARMQTEMPRFFLQGAPPIQPVSAWILAPLTIGFGAIPIYFLVRRKSAFR